MINITADIAVNIHPHVAEQCAARLCHDESEMQGVFNRIALLSLSERERSWMIAYAWQPHEDEVQHVVGWVSVTEWDVGDETRIQVQGYVDPAFRERGLASAMVACLCHDMPKTQLPVAVFSREFFAIAHRFGWNATRYKHVTDGWLGVATTDGRGIAGRADEAGLHAHAPEVRSLPLARDEAGEET
jgi:GNAT superfamily N-acetyltransferase